MKMNDNKEDKEWLYGKLKDNGLSISYDDFDKTLSNEEDRKWYYNKASGIGLQVGSYDDFSRMFGNVQTEPDQQNQTADRTEMNGSSTVLVQPESEIESMQRPSLRQQVEGVNGFHIPSQAEMQAKFDVNGNRYPNFSENIRVAANSGSLDNIVNNEEEGRLNESFKPASVNNQGDIYRNYASRFSKTERGKQLSDELASIQQEVSSKYADQYLKSNEYRQLASQYSGDELDRRANEQFDELYGKRIQNDIEPYQRAYSNEVMNRYGSNIEKESNELVKKQVGKQLNELSGKVDSMITKRGKQLEKESEGKWWLDLPRGGGGAVTTTNFASNQGRNFDPEYQQLQAASSLIDNSKDIINEASKKGNTNFVAGLGRGIRDSFNADNWTFGITELAKNMNLNQVLDKSDKGEQLSESEQALLDALVTNMAVNAYYSSDLGKGYQAGQTTGASIPFMLEFAVNPVSASGSGIAKSILRYGARRFGLASTRGAVRKAVLSGARLLGDAAAAAGMTATTGMPGVLAETQQRMMGDVSPEYTEEGRAAYGGRQNQQGAGEAFAKSTTSHFLENQSEMVFNAFPGIGEAIGKAIPGGMTDIIKRFGNSRIGQPMRDLYREIKSNELLRNIAQRTQFHGLGEEYMEEVYNNFASIPLGDMTFEDAISLDNNINTLLGLAPTSVAFSMIGLGGLARERYNNRRNMRRAFGKFTPDQQRMFNDLQQKSRQNGNEDIKNFIKMTIEDPDLTQEQKRDEIQYAWEIARSNAIDDIQEEETQEQVDAENADIDDHTDPQTGMYTEMDRIIINDVGEEVRIPGYKTGEIGGMPVWVPEGDDVTPKNSVVLKPGEWDDGTLRSMPASEVKAQNEAMIREDVQVQAEQESAYSPDIPPLQVGTTFQDNTGTYEVVQQNADGGWLAKKTTTDEKGNQKEEIVPVDEQGYRNIMQANIDAEEEAREKSNQQKNEITPNQDVINSATPKDYMKANPSIVEGYITTHPEQVQIRLNDEVQKTADYLNGNTNEKGYLSSMGYVDSYLNSASDEEISEMAKELSDRYRPYLNISSQNQQTSDNGFNVLENNAGNAVDTSEGQSNMSEQTAPLQDNGETLQADAGQASQQEAANEEPVQQQESSVPVDEKGNPQYYRVPVDVTLKSIADEQLEPEEVDAFIEANQKEADKNLKKVQDKAPKMGTNIAAYKKAKAEWQEKVADAQAQSDYWKQVKDELTSIRTRPGDTTAQEILQFGEPLNGDELAAMMLGNGSLPLLRESYMGELGAGNKEAQGMFGLFASKENGGMTIEEAGERLMEADRENGTHFFEQNDPNAGRNAIIDVLSSARTKGDLTRFIQNNRERMAEQERQAEYAAYEDWCESYMHMTVPEYEAYQDYIMENNPYDGVDAAELDHIFAEAEQEYQTYLNESENGQGTNESGGGGVRGTPERDEQGGETGIREESIPVLSGTQPVLQGQVQGRVGGTEERPGEADDVVRDADGNVSESSSREGISVTERGGQGDLRYPSGRQQDNSSQEAVSEKITPIGESDFGFVYDQFKGDAQGAIRQLIKMQDGEALGALHHEDIGDIDLVWGKAGTKKSDGYGLAKLVKFHPEVLDNLQSILDGMSVTKRSENRIQLEDANYQAAVRLTWNGEEKIWLLTAFKKKETSEPTNSRTDVDSNLNGVSDDTATRHSSDVPSESKDSELPSNNQEETRINIPKLQEGENLLDFAERVVKNKEIDDARRHVEVNPTDAQKEAGNYKKGHVKLDGYDITIENPKGSVRSGVDANGQSWSVTMNNDYGYIRDTEGVDGDHIDVFLSDDPTTGDVFVIDQVNEDGTFDEHKVMYGFKSALAAKRAYLANYSPGWKGLGTITKVSKEEFKKWINSSRRKTKSFAEYKSVNKDSEPVMRQVDVEGLMQAINENGEAKLSDHFVMGRPGLTEKATSRQTESTAQEKKTKNSGQFGLVSDERMEELKKRLKQKILGQMNMGVDPEILAIGMELTAGYIDRGIKKFADYAKVMIDSLGDDIRPYLKAFYNGARDLPEVQKTGLADEMTPYDEVRTFDVANFDKDVPNILDAAETIAKEQEVEQQAETAKDILTEQRDAGIDGLRPATEEDIEQNPIVFYNGNGYGILMVVRTGEQTGPTTFGKSRITGVVLHNGKSVPLKDLKIRDTKPTTTEQEEISESEVTSEKNTPTTEKKLKSKKKRAKKSVSLSLNDLFNQTEKNNEQRSTEPDSSMGNQTRQEVERTEQRGTDGSLHGDNEPNASGSGSISRAASTGSSRNAVRNRNNYHFPESGISVPQGEIAKLKANVEAIRTLKEIEASGQPATDAQKEILSKYVGWGGLANALDTEKYNQRDSYFKDISWNSKYLSYYEQLQELLTPEEFQSAVQSTTTSHYTPSNVIKALWNIVEKSGFKGGEISEPAMGVGHIIGMMPESISGQSNISGYEIDSLSGRIASKLYPDANVKVQGYETSFSPQSKDLVITNVPFGRQAPYDKKLDRTLKRRLGNAYNLHNYFIAKGLLELKEGGIGVFITSSATMDGADSRFREFAAGNNVDLIGAIRLPNDAFQKNAGTSVTADILVFRKRKAGEASNGIDFISTTQIGEGRYEEDGDMRTKPIMVNEYFAEHPDMMLGEMMTAFDAGSGGLYSGASQTLKPKEGSDLTKELDDAIGRFPENFLGNYAEQAVRDGEAKKSTKLKNGTITTENGKVYVASNGELVPIDVKETFTFNGETRKTADAVNDYNSLKDTLKRLIHAEQTEKDNPKELRKELNDKYDAFVGKYGTLNRNKSLDDVFAEDYEHNLPLSLEDVKRVPSPTGKSMVWQVTKGKGILDKRISYPINEPTSAENLQDAVNISISYKGVLDIPYMAKLMGISKEQVTQEMLEKGAAYRDPVTGSLVDRDSYLSGNVREKLEEARSAAESNPEFQKNVDDLMEVQPETIRFGDISYRLGTPWIPVEFVNDFALNELGIANTDIQFEPLLNEFIVSKRARIDDFAKSGMFKTGRVNTIDLFTAALNQRKPKIYDERITYGPNGKTTERIPNEAETQAASEKIMEISDKFIEYIDGKTAIHRELERIYNDKYNNYRLKKYSLPSFSHVETDKYGNKVMVTHYPGSNTELSMREHQAKAVQRSLHESTLLAHQVGTGKTFTMITTAMEMRRLGLARKPMIVVQNATLEDFVKDFYRLYPSANVLAPSKDERSAENRKRLFNLIATGDFDAIVIPQSFLAFIPDDEGRKAELIQKRIEDYVEAISKTDDYALKRRLEKEMRNLKDNLEVSDKKAKRSTVKQRANAAERAKSRAERVLDRRTDDVMTFEKMGIDALFIDEAHNFKKIGFATKMNNVKGVDSGASQRANSLLLKARWVQEKNGGRNVILATGTPITNTMAEVWTMMNFVSPDILEAYNIQSFDDFATTFGTVEPSLEFTATGNFKIADRFKSYVNVPELVKAFRSHADVVLTEDVKEFQQKNNIPKLSGGRMENVVIDKNEDLEDVMQMLVKELEDYNKLTGAAKREKSALPLVVFTKAKQAAIDLRLLNPTYVDNPNSKTNQVVRNIVKFYQESTPEKGTQLVFCDSYQSPGEKPKMDLFDYDPDVPRFNLYEDIKQKLIASGIPEKEIAIVNNYDGERRKSLFEKVRNGDVRVLIGSTEKMGVGVNVQDRLFALHHVDAPLRPMDFEQRNGRILRQGNLYATWDKPVHVLTYGVQGTLDATAYDRLRVKQEFINQMMKGNTDSRVMEEQDDEDPSGMTFSQMAATLSGDKTAQLLFAAQNKLKRLRNSKRSDANSKSAMSDSINAAKNRISVLKNSEKAYERALEIVDKNFPNGVKKLSVNGITFTEKFGTSIEPIIESYDDAYSLNRGEAPLRISLNDGSAEIIVHFNDGRMVYELYAGKEHIVDNRQFNGGKGLMSSIDYQLESVKKNLSEVRSNIQAQQKKIDGLTKAINTPWGREDELKESEKEVENLKKQLENKAKENNDSSKRNDNVFYRQGTGEVSDDELSNENDPIAKMLGHSNRTRRKMRIFSNRERQRMTQRVQELAEKLHLNNVNIVTDSSILDGQRARAKGFYNRSTGKITIVIPNHTSVFDAEQTLLHEAVAHYGLRELFGEHFDTFLDNVYRNAEPDVRRKIVELAQKNGWNMDTATEEYLASLAEDTNFDDISASWWGKIKSLFLHMLHQIGFRDFDGVTLSDNELRYILWRSYENLAEPERYRSILGEAADIAKQNELKVGNYASDNHEASNAAETSDLYRMTPEGEIEDGSRDAYNRSVTGNRFKAQEAYQDSMLSLKRLQEVVERYSGKKLQSFENAYMAENQMSSKNTREKEVYGEKFFKPMIKSVGELMKKGASYGEIVDYMIAKHGLERNESFAYRDAELQTERRFSDKYKELEKMSDNGLLTDEEYQKRKDKLDSEKASYYQTRVSKNLEKDYSGLTALAVKHDVNEEAFKQHAKDVVSDFESRFNASDLWNKVNAATKETLRKAYESGMMSRDTYNKVRGQFKYYIPLRGWDEMTAEDVYEYLNSETSPVNSVLKSAKGRKSLADDPFATIGNMAESAIHQGNRNLMKQNFLNMAINHPTDVVTLKEAWYVQDPSTGDWVISFPDIQDGDSADVIADKIEEHEQRMKELEENGEATKVKDGLNIDYRIGIRQAREHIVDVKRNGKDYLVFVNGNPRAAQAVNGLTNPDAEPNKWLAAISRFNRELAANFTNRNPAFVLSNLSRDLIFSVSAVGIKENPKYATRFVRNIPKAMAVIARNLRGKGNPNNADDRMFEEFLSNGGETGYTIMNSVDEYKKMVRRELNKKEITEKTDYFKAVRASVSFFSMMNRWSEDVSRFTTYMTSREMGRPITQSVNDAKEVTVNFNRRGAAAKTSGVFGWTAGMFRNLYLFFNAGVQSLANFGRLAKNNRRAFITTLAGFSTAGFMVPVLNAIAISLTGDGDDDYYGNLPEWVRRNNLCIYVPGSKGKFITIPLPIELRAFYGLGEMAYQETIGKEGSSGGQIAYKAINQITELLPLNPLGNNGDIVSTIMPDVLSPIWQAYKNKDFTGKPIYRKNAFNENMPEWTKAYNSTADWLVDLSEWTNELAGGDKYKKGELFLSDWNPAIVEHLFESYFGGMAKTINQTAKTIGGGVESVFTGKKSDELQWYSTPVLNRFVNDASDDRSSFSKVNQRYYNLYDLYNEVGKNLRGYSNEVARGNLDYLDKLRDLYQSDDYKRYLIFKNNKKVIDRIKRIEKKLPEDATNQKEMIQNDVNKLKRSLVEQVEKMVP